MPRGKIGAGRPQRGDERSRWRAAATIWLAMTALLSLGAMAAEPARAGTYVMRSCDVPGHPYAPLGPWTASSYTPEPTPKMVVADACAAGGGVGFSFAGSRTMTPGSAWARLAIAKPPTGPQSEIRLVSVAAWYAARFGGSGQEMGLFASEDDSDKALDQPVARHRTAWCGEPQFQAAVQPHECRWLLGRHVLRARAGSGSPRSVRSRSTRRRFTYAAWKSRSAKTSRLRSGGPRGRSWPAGQQSGVRTLSYTASDLHSGLARVDVLLGDTVVKSHDLTPRCFYSDFTACPTSDDETLEVDTRLVPNGSYDLVLRVRDAAGNEQVVHGERAIEVANESPSVSASACHTRSSRTSKARRARRSRCPMVDE